MNDHRARRNPSRIIPGPPRFEIARQGLLARLAASKAKLALLVAPSGYGKTTLLAQYARTGSRRTVWLTLTEAHAEPMALASSLVLALEASGISLEAIRTGAVEGIETGVLAHAVNGLEDTIEFVLDGLERLGSEGRRWLGSFIESLREGHRVLAAGYDDADLRVAHLVSRGQALVIGAADLAFSVDEARDYLEGRGSRADPQEAHHRLEGWAAGLALVAAGATPHAAPDDLVHEALGALPDDLRCVLPEASVLEVWSEAGAREVGGDLPEGWLPRVARSGLLVTPLESGLYRPHRLLADVLERELSKRPERHAALHGAAAEVAVRAGNELEAIAHLRLARRDPEALELASRVVSRFERRGAYGLMRRVLEPFEANALSDELALKLGVSLAETGDPERGEAIIRERDHGDSRASVLANLSAIAARQRQPERALALVEEALALPLEPKRRAAFLKNKSLHLFALGRAEEALSCGLEARRLADELGDLSLALGCATAYQAFYAALGRPLERMAVLEEALEMAATLEARGSSESSPVRVIPLRHDLALALYLRGERTHARAMLEDVLLEAERVSPMHAATILGTRGKFRQLDGDFAGAAADFRDAVRRGDELGYERFHLPLRLCAAESEWWAGLRSLESLAFEVSSAAPRQPLEAFTVAFYRGFVAFQRGDLGTARTAFEEAIDNTIWRLHAARARAYLLEIERREHRLERATVEAFVTVIERLGGLEVLRADVRALYGLYATCVRRGWCRAQLEPFAVAPDPSATCRISLEIHTLGHFAARLDGRPVRLSGKPAELIVWLALNGPARRDEILDALWDGSRARNDLEYGKVTIRRVRDALKAHTTLNPLPFEDGVYRLAEALKLRVDATELLGAADRHRDDPVRLRAILESNGGEFLPGVETEWAVQTRMNLLESGIAVALALGHALERSDPRAAAAAYLRARQLDPLGEAGSQALERLRAALGDAEGARFERSSRERSLEREFGTLGEN